MKKKALLFSVFIFLSGITILLSGKKLDKRVNAGVLPYCYDCNGVAYFLIGKEPSKVWADFGGKSEKKILSHLLLHCESVQKKHDMCLVNMRMV